VPTATLFNKGNLIIEAQCSGSGSGADLQALARSSAPNGVFQVFGVSSGGTLGLGSDSNFGTNENVPLQTAQFQRFSATAVYSGAGGALVTFSYLADDATAEPPQGECLFVGTAVTD